MAAQQKITAKVIAADDGLPLVGAVIKVKDSHQAVSTDTLGRFSIVIQKSDADLIISSVGYHQKIVRAGSLSEESNLAIALEPSVEILEDLKVVATGYQKLPKERATGSFATVDRELFNQQVSTDILSRLPGVANSLMMDNGSRESPQLMIRGLSTISGPRSPLIVLDNFPYEGDINNINPNIVESVTVLKDAAAASIWGARAANGVIVITTKTARFNQPIQLELNANLTVGAAPDLGYIPQMASDDFIDLEAELFRRGFYNSQIIAPGRPLLSPVVDLLQSVRSGAATEESAFQKMEEWKRNDARSDFRKYMYSPSVKQQYYLSANGGSSNFLWSSSIAYDHNKETLGNTFQRLNLQFKNTYKISKKLSVTTGLYYTQTQAKSGRSGYNDVTRFVPYMKMADEKGTPLAVGRAWNQSFIENFGEGLLMDWNYYPLNDWQHQRNSRALSDILMTAAINYRVVKGLDFSINYQYELQKNESNNIAGESSYMARDYINRFSQLVNGNAVYIVPKGGILDTQNGHLLSNSVRGQFSFDRKLSKHHINALAGWEARLNTTKSHQARFYGYNADNLYIGNVDYTRAYPNSITGGNSFIQNNQNLTETDVRFLSQFANASYTYSDRYIVSASVRRDASNLFGLKTNDQWNPFWSGGVAWKVSKERFLQSSFLSDLTLRGTYGFSGNVNPAMVAVNTIRFLPNLSLATGLPQAQFENFYNPLLKWETSKMLNLGIDFTLKTGRLSGSIEYYRKRGVNLFGVSPTDYTTGIPPSMLRNVASMKGNGWDIEVKSINLKGALHWTTTLNLSFYKDKVVDYLINRTLARQYVSSASPPISGIAGSPVYSVYAYPWAGLDADTGEAQGYLNGEVSKDYNSITGVGTKIDDLAFFGSAIPTCFGSVLNSLSWRGINLQFGLVYKLGYYFRRNSIDYTNLFGVWRGHSDYSLRWQQSGDEQKTNVPSNPYSTNSQRDEFYSGSSVLVERGDHVRLQYINMGYTFKTGENKIIPFNGLNLYINISNPGLLWSSTKTGIDPDFNGVPGAMVTPVNYTIGVRAKF